MLAAEKLRKGQTIRTAVGADSSMDGLHKLASSEYPRAQSNALKVLELLSHTGTMSHEKPRLEQGSHKATGMHLENTVAVQTFA